MFHFIGIKGSGMSSLAIVMKRLGYSVEGSDYDKHFFTENMLISNGISIFPFDKSNIHEGMTIVRGNSFGDDNVEISEAKRLNLKIYSYQEMVDFITKDYDLVAVSGCHGKTTTSKLLSCLLDSNYLVGDGSGDISSSPYFVLEACEYRRHFLNYHPKITVITNIDFDHVDYFVDIDDVVSAYQEFADRSSIVIGCGDDLRIRGLHGVNYFYGLDSSNDFFADNVLYDDSGISFDFKVHGDFIKHVFVPFFGKHMVLNTLAALSVYYIEGFDLNSIDEKLLSFKGASRRFDEYVILDNVVVDDYAHHPAEVKSVLDAVRQKYPDKKIVSIFEPHTFSRVKAFYKEIASVLNLCDYSYVMDIYKSRENPLLFPDVTSSLIIDNLNCGEHIDFLEVSKLLKYKNSVLVFMSPNDLSCFINEYIRMYKLDNNNI